MKQSINGNFQNGKKFAKMGKVGSIKEESSFIVANDT